MASTRPYLIRAIYDWTQDNGYTPFVLVDTSVDGVVVPEQFIKDNSIVLNVSPSAVRDLNVGDDFISFNARFSGISQELFVPISSVRAVYAKENGEGIVLPVETSTSLTDETTPTTPHLSSANASATTTSLHAESGDSKSRDSDEKDKPSKRKPPHLTIVE
ncbi:MAG: ClpXP protease specificity-enhancing factor [Gammaproteobacteria bacterium]